uniref:Uncharacterized protein n=1 Tax=Megaselia scalaris TaxID=36166 RepID=T1GPQ9_MEGSC
MLNNNDKDLQRDLIDTQDTINRVFDVNEESKALSLGIINGICIPKICKPEDLKFLPFNLTKCTGKKEYPWETLDYVAISLTSVIGVLLLLGTAYDYIFKGDNRNRFLL